MALVAVVPELAVSMAIQQREDAKNSLKNAREIVGDEERFTLAHAFYANMGGLIVKRPEATDEMEVHKEHSAGGVDFIGWSYLSLEDFGKRFCRIPS